MKKFYKLNLLFGVVFLFFIWTDGNSQVSIRENAEQTNVSLKASASGTNNRSGVAYNPLKQVYYSVDAGNASFPVDSYNAAGELLDSVASGFDFRGAWWNPLLYTFEGNGYNSLGIFSKAIDPFTGVAVTGGSVVAANTQPGTQSCGDLDTANYEIIYYSGGSIYRYSRLDDQALGSAAITGLPGGTTLNSYGVFYTGIEGMEYGVYDYTNLRFIFLNRLAEYVGFSQLPGTAFAASSYKTSWANRLFWVYDDSETTWFSYNVLEGYPLGIKNSEINDSRDISIYPNPVTTETRLDLGDLNSEVTHIRLLSVNGEVLKDITDIPSTTYTLNLGNESKGMYILQVTTLEGENYFRKLIKQ